MWVMGHACEVQPNPSKASRMQYAGNDCTKVSAMSPESQVFEGEIP